jgi:ParB-like chromosome segregation protein Spo0J
MYEVLMNITYIPISKLKSNEQNPRKIVKSQFEKLCKNIQEDPEFFAMRPCLVNETEEGMLVYAGNQRLQAAKKLKLKEVPCLIAKNVPQETIKKRILLDNIHHGEHDYDMLSSLYEADELIGMGMLEKELHLDEESMDDLEDQLADECHKCEMCGKKLGKNKK